MAMDTLSGGVAVFFSSFREALRAKPAIDLTKSLVLHKARNSQSKWLNKHYFCSGFKNNLKPLSVMKLVDSYMKQFVR